ncbi:hypothetical protein FA13DRAFT_1784959 [Coprinellus micaceus]|uniref:Uncharacterized protein n=1 Tax=Coprinellus micaceus TaxID=71717 RepID=A0A4Y7TWV4_COPMI|nr:hypothetical protein FA13DRAFT_1784959 [Coprinellus micaceus]
MNMYGPVMAYHSPSADFHMDPVYAPPPFPSFQPSTYGYREDFSLPPVFPEPRRYTYSPSQTPPGGIQGPPSMPSEPSYMDPNSGHPGPFGQSLPFTQPSSRVGSPYVPGGGYHGSWSSFEDNSHGLSPGAPSYPLAGPAIAPYQAVTSPDEHSYPPTGMQIAHTDPIGSAPSHAGDTSQRRYGAGSIVHGGEHATSGHGSEPTGDVQPPTFPIFLVKRKVDSKVLTKFTELVDDDGTHWALQVNGMQYHILPSEDNTIQMARERIEPVAPPEEVGQTAYSHGEIVEICIPGNTRIHREIQV